MYLVLALFAYPRGMFFIGLAFLARSLYALRNNTGDRLLLAKTTFGIFALVLAVRVLAAMIPSGYSIFYGVPLLLVFVIAVKGCIDTAVMALALEHRRRLVNLLLATEILTLAVILVPMHSERTVALDTTWGTIYLPPSEADSARLIYDFVSSRSAKDGGFVGARVADDIRAHRHNGA